MLDRQELLQRNEAQLRAMLAEMTSKKRDLEGIRLPAGMSDKIDVSALEGDVFVAIETLKMGATILKAVRYALQKIADNKYGICERCKDPISEKRLDAQLTAVLCIMCQDMQPPKDVLMEAVTQGY